MRPGGEPSPSEVEADRDTTAKTDPHRCAQNPWGLAGLPQVLIARLFERVSHPGPQFNSKTPRDLQPLWHAPSKEQNYGPSPTSKDMRIPRLSPCYPLYLAVNDPVSALRRVYLTARSVTRRPIPS